MADKEEDKNNTSSRGNDWEVVSLTASAYAASPGPVQVLDLLYDAHKETTETSHPLYMSRHFDLDQSIATEILEDKSTSKNMDFGFSAGQETEETGSLGKEEQVEDLSLKGLNLSSDEFFEDKGERAIGENELTDAVIPTVVPDEKHEAAENIPPWWKRSAASLISQAKETNTVWSIFIAAAVMGIVIIGHHWKRERWQTLQLNWETSIGNEKAGRLLGPVSRLRQAFVGGQRRDTFIRMNSQNEG